MVSLETDVYIEPNNKQKKLFRIFTTTNSSICYFEGYAFCSLLQQPAVNKTSPFLKMTGALH